MMLALVVIDDVSCVFSAFTFFFSIGIYGIRMAGLAIAVGTWASIMIMVNFLFGIVIFREPVYDILGTLASFVLLIIGLVGMALYSAPQKGDTPTPSSSSSLIQNLEDNSGQMTPMEDPLTQDLVVNGERMDIQLGEMRSSHVHAHFVLCGIPLSQRQCGILGAAMNGVFTGSSLVPLHYAKEEGFGGANFMISMASGSMIANILVWCCFFGFTTIANQTTWQDGLQRMPRWYFKELWFPGFMAGLLLAIAMFGSILAVTYLGQGVGNSLVQTKILVSGLWGIFFYKEVRGTKTIAMWFLSATVAVLAIIWLSLERLLAQGQQTGH